MSFPASLPTRVVKGRFVTPRGRAAQGTVRIVLNNFMQGPADDLFVTAYDETIPLDSNGAFSVRLPATDAPGWTPSSYKIVVTITNAERPDHLEGIDRIGPNWRPADQVLRHTLSIPHSETGPIDLADVANIPAPIPGQSYIVAASKGSPGGVATLDENGKVPSSQLPPASGGGGGGGPVSWNDVQDKPTSFPARSIVHVQSQPSTSWDVVHSFGREPNVVIVIDGESVMADVKYPTPTTVAINFGAPQTGKALLT